LRWFRAGNVYLTKAGRREKCAAEGIRREGGEVVQGEKCGKEDNIGELASFM